MTAERRGSRRSGGLRIAREVEVRFEVAVPPWTPPGAAVFLCGSHKDLGHWNGRGIELAPIGERRFAASTALPMGETIEFKATRGDWGSVESSAYGHEIPNRVVEIRGPQIVGARVAGWQDSHRHAPRSGPIEGKVSLFSLSSRALRGARRCWVYTPPASCGPGPFPLLMCLDGQNCFHWGRAPDSMPNSWLLDVTADRLIRRHRMRPIVIAALANDGRHRLREYTPWRDPFRLGGGEARRTYTALRDEFLPAVSRRFPVALDAVTNGIMGSSLAGLFSLWAALQEPNLFGRAGVVSPAFFWGLVEIHDFLRSRTLEAHKRIWMDVGTNEIVSVANVFQDLYLALVRGVRNELEDRGLPPGAKLHYEEFEFAGHNEADWADRVDRILPFLYPPS